LISLLWFLLSREILIPANSNSPQEISNATNPAQPEEYPMMKRAVVTAVMIWTLTAAEDMCPNGLFKIPHKRRYSPFFDNPSILLDTEMDLEEAFKGKRMLEIGGPTPHTTVYDFVEEADNVVHSALFEDFASFTHGDHDDPGKPPVPKNYDRGDLNGLPFLGPNGRILGTTFHRHGANLSGIDTESYEIVFSSHSLEHFLDPISALKEWNRVLSPRGYLILVLPHALNCSDKHRQPVVIQELLQIHSMALEVQMGGRAEDYAKLRERYLELYVRLFHDHDEFDPWGLGEELDLQRRRDIIRAVVREKGDDMVHWHAWDFDVIVDAVEGCLGFELKLLNILPPADGLHCPFHQILLAQKRGN